MNFNSIGYLVFLAGNVLVFYLLPHRARAYQLLLGSYFFYMCWNPAYALLMLLSTVVTYGCGLLVGGKVWNKRKLWLTLSFLLNLGILFFFKYFNFLSDLIGQGLSLLGLAWQPPLLNVLLPVGISFYTFQALGYTVDVYRGDILPERNFAYYALFVSFFPQLVAGPIERSGNMLRQIKEEHPFRPENLRDGALPVLWGLFKKVVLADNLAVMVNAVYNAPGAHSGGAFVLATVAFAIQIYCDFSAYTDIARGSAKMLGFELMENFRCPYFATSIQDFWRRWHISLSSWFRDYLYVPLGGNRKGKARQLLNLMIVFFVSGLWHGAALTFVVWGLLNGLYQVISILLRPVKQKLLTLLHIGEENPALHLFRILFTFFLTCVAWVLFRANSLTDAAAIFQSLLALPQTGFTADLLLMNITVPALWMLGICTAVLLTADYFITERGLMQKINRSVAVRYAVYFVILAAILIFGSWGDGFAPQDFVYFQF